MSGEVLDMLAEAPARAAASVSVATAPLAGLTGPMAAALQAINAGVSVADLQGLLAVQKDWEANEARKAYVADMAAFKLNPPEIFKTKAVTIKLKDGTPGPAYSHATLGDVCEKIVEGLAEHGFSHRWSTLQPDGGQIFVTCTLTHRLGHSEATTLNSSRDDTGSKNNIQALASTISYLQRYTLLAASGLATKDLPPDDDGAGAGGAGGVAVYDPAANLQSWTEAANACTTQDALKEIRSKAGFDFTSNKDAAGWERFKAIHDARRDVLTASGAQ